VRAREASEHLERGVRTLVVRTEVEAGLALHVTSAGTEHLALRVTPRVTPCTAHPPRTLVTLSFAETKV